MFCSQHFGSHAFSPPSSALTFSTALENIANHGFQPELVQIFEENNVSPDVMTFIAGKNIKTLKQFCYWGGATEEQFRVNVAHNIVLPDDVADVSRANLVAAWVDSCEKRVA